MYSIAPSPTPTLLSDPVTSTPPDTSAPSIFRYIIGFLLIGVAWGFTTPFIRAAARTHQPPSHPILSSPSVTKSFVKSKLYGAFFGAVDLLRNPRYAIPLVINLTGSIWFFLLIGQAVLGEWWVERKVISRGNSPRPFPLHPFPINTVDRSK
ncbi:hypothetical protein BCON_0051g00350 [Botryotinia convoluta]|uniref:Integral membrane protein n=1 Tax=Botryotinia convoluta TaxID=54673 RepID=A0A4Z1IBX3_9HELO|nr:hypothetical protein BCON_0051g00350 [Botryotinia convoluta]